jgi:acyl dehydratase
MVEHYFEDLRVGDRYEFGSITVTEEMIVEFAEQYVPQDFHVDPEIAEESMFGGLIAAGWHTVSLTAKMLVESEYGDFAHSGGRGADNLRWIRPVRPGDTLSGWVEIGDRTPPTNGNSTGDVRFDISVFNQDAEKVLSMEVDGLVDCRERNGA